MEKAFYDYFEEQPIGASGPSARRHKVPRQIANEFFSDDYSLLSPIYGFWKTRELEGRTHLEDSEGVWPINDLRVSRFWGMVGERHCPHGTTTEELTPEMDAAARNVRLHHYFRVRDAQECQVLLQRSRPVNLALEITDDWFDPPGGVIPLPGDNAVPSGAHSAGLRDFDPRRNVFRFPNSWGEEWGDHGWGYLPKDCFDRDIIEAWSVVGLGVITPIQATTGIVCLSWKSSIDSDFGVHGREIVDAATGDRLAWAFAVRRGQFLDVDEFFVWPTYRRQGYARVLVDMLLKLANDTKSELRAWVPFADCEEANRPGLVRVFELLGLGLQASDERWAAYVGTKEPPTKQLVSVRIPPRPGSVRHQLAHWEYTVWYGTNRKPIDASDPSKGYGSERDQTTHYGSCKVAIPESHRFGSIDDSWWRRCLRIERGRLFVRSRAELAREVFWSTVRDEIASHPEDERQSLVFLHGYNVEFDEAAKRAAQIGFDLKMPGETAFFSWPSQGDATGYHADEASIEASEAAITDFLIRFVQEVSSDYVYLIAHSMGNRGLLRALQRITSNVSVHTPTKFRQIFLAAPDVDVDLFRDLAALCQTMSDRTTLYASPKDKALGLSGWIHDYARAGFIPPVTVVEGVDTIEVPGFDILSLGHSYYAEAAAILHDLFDLIRRNADPDDRQRLVPMTTETGARYWRIWN
ncbi:MAG: alpha/beta hydrolase [Pirellulales bacterium]|nr:alpha/beta hydrolase [Pirellulales bacterium]